MARSLIVGTAGHIDHGKSALVQALTGTDPDRLKEEKERGITIDIGFAHLDLDEGLVASFIDVPGHERFVRNMLAGAHGIDAVLLVVAADESVMPQTREHFHICRLLGVRRGLVVLTKCDLAEPDLLGLAELEVGDLVRGSFLDGAPVLRTSARTGEGLEALRCALRTLAADLPPRPGGGLLRLPIDRVFTLRGFGTVVTGTIVSGGLDLGGEVAVLPSARRGRVRGLQVHGRAVDRAEAGSRAALNLAGLDVGELERGDVIAYPGTLAPTALLDVELSLLPGERPLRDGARVRVHLASAEVLARVRLLGQDILSPGQKAAAQLRLERKAVAGRGDRLVVRSYSPATTIAGAVVLDPLPPRRRQAPPPAAGRGDAAGAALAMIGEAGTRGVAAAVLSARLTVPRSELPALLVGSDQVVVLAGGESFLAREAAARLDNSTREALAAFHRQQPLRAWMPREELRARVFTATPAGAFEHVLSDMEAQGAVVSSAEGVASSGHEVRLSGPEQQARDTLLVAVKAAGLEGVEAPRLATSLVSPDVLDRVARLLAAEGALRRVGNALVDGAALDQLKEEVRRRWPPGSRLDVGAFKDMTGLSRKFVIPLLEYLDRERVTRRAGADRLVLA